MSNTKHFIVIGLGSFGSALAQRLCKNGCRVTAIDASSDRVDALKDVVYEAIIGDATERETIGNLPVKDADAVFVSMGEDITRSLLATLHAKELGAREVIVKGVTQEHGKILKSLGVGRVIFPEIEIAEELADRMTWTNIVDFLPIDPDYSFIEIAVPDSFAKKTLHELNIRQEYGVWIVGIKDAMSGKLTMFPAGDFEMEADQLLLVVGRHEELGALREMK